MKDFQDLQIDASERTEIHWFKVEMNLGRIVWMVINLVIRENSHGKSSWFALD